ncbi:MAG: adenylyl-sulfate kinase [Ignavibacteria bacterium]
MPDPNIIPQKHRINKDDRKNLLGNDSFVIWFTGLSGSGKSTLANLLEQRLNEKRVLTYLLDGDNVRAGLNKDLGFGDEDRIENIRRLGEVSKLFLDAGIVVLTAFISPFRSDRETVRELVGKENFHEVYVKCTLELCESRDVKGLYSKARAGQIPKFTGIDSPYEEPLNAELVIDTSALTIEDSVSLLDDYVSGLLKRK